MSKLNNLSNKSLKFISLFVIYFLSLVFLLTLGPPNQNSIYVLDVLSNIVIILISLMTLLCLYTFLNIKTFDTIRSNVYSIGDYIMSAVVSIASAMSLILLHVIIFKDM